MSEELNELLDLKVAAVATVWPYDKRDPRTEAFDRAICVLPVSERDPSELVADLSALIEQVDAGLAESLAEVLNIVNQKIGGPTCTNI